jgi:hypothetical protein
MDLILPCDETLQQTLYATDDVLLAFTDTRYITGGVCRSTAG